MSTDDEMIAQALEQMGDAPLPDVDATDTDSDVEETASTEVAGDIAESNTDTDNEEVKEPVKDPVKEEPKLSKALARVARREAAALELETQVRQREETLTSREQQVEAASKRWASLVDLGKRDPVRFLREAGIDIDELSRQLVSGEAPPKVDPLQKRIDELEAKLEGRTQQEDAYREQQRVAAVERHLRDLEAYAESKPDGYAFVNVVPPKRAAMAMQAIIRSHWERTKIVLDRTEAARILNGQLEEHHKLTSQAANQQQAAAPRETQGTKVPGTIGKDHRSRTAKVPGRDKMTDKELVEAALKAWEG